MTESKIQNPKSKIAEVVGYVGLWMMPDQAHITAIAVRRDYRGRGLGELLLQEALALAYRLKAPEVTLEVRVSNVVAQSLYRKYDFAEAGLRRGYYSDDREDALILTLSELPLPRYRRRLRGLRRRLDARLAAG
ncbi:MAG: ribosomal protein S18-alanine N-acetyltransferase [Chloroflexi bacterium]|nr:ribosomal protein S18-alanine N-acetyltransferase [Chloroflexota bacterium]